MVVGSVLAIAQTDVKRMLAYSSIAHAGFILIGLSRRDTPAAIQAAMFYLVAYAAMVLGAFGVVMLVSARGRGRTDLARPTPGWPAAARSWPALMTLFLLSLAGIPPTAGFIAKVRVFARRDPRRPLAARADRRAGQVAAAFFYLRVIVADVHAGAGRRGRAGRGAEARGGRGPWRCRRRCVLGVFPRSSSGSSTRRR